MSSFHDLDDSYCFWLFLGCIDSFPAQFGISGSRLLPFKMVHHNFAWVNEKPEKSGFWEEREILF